MSITNRHSRRISWGVRRLRVKNRPEPPQRKRRIYAAAALLLAGYLLFAHGCHGDEDNELFAGLADALALVK
jgi:hypothetical protein